MAVLINDLEIIVEPPSGPAAAAEGEPPAAAAPPPPAPALSPEDLRAALRRQLEHASRVYDA